MSETVSGSYQKFEDEEGNTFFYDPNTGDLKTPLEINVEAEENQNFEYYKQAAKSVYIGKDNEQKDLEESITKETEQQKDNTEKIIDKLKEARNVSINIALPRIAQSMLKHWIDFITAIAGRNINASVEVNLPRISDSALRTWAAFLTAAAGKNIAANIDINLPKMSDSSINSWTKFVGAVAGKNVNANVDVNLPSMSMAMIQAWTSFLNALNGGGQVGGINLAVPPPSVATIKIEVPESLKAGIPIDPASIEKMKLDSIANSLASLAAMKGVIWL
jgi:hypothetical protein